MPSSADARSARSARSASPPRTAGRPALAFGALAVGALTLGALATLAPACAASGDHGFSTTERPNFDSDAGTPDGAGPCVAASVNAESVPLAMLVLVDRSNSMNGTKWTAATSALRVFADGVDVGGMEMGLQFFPPLSAADECAPASYTVPAVGIRPLPQNVLAIHQRLDATEANGGSTPMSAALRGSLQTMSDYLAEHADHQGVVILVTDGDPTKCGGISEVIKTAAEAAEPADGSMRIRTFTIGLDGAKQASLDQVAAAGVGFSTLIADQPGDVVQKELMAALERVRRSAVGCEYQLPSVPAEQGVVDLNAVTIRLTGGEGGDVTFDKVDSAGACGTKSGGYYYDSAENPTRVMLCPASCNVVRDAPSTASVELALGCVARPAN